MEFELLNELVENGYDGEDLDELFEFCVDFALEYEGLVENLNEEELEEFGFDSGEAGKAYADSMGTRGKSKRKINKMSKKEAGKRRNFFQKLKRDKKLQKRLGGAGLALTAAGGGAAVYKRRKAKKAEQANESAELLAKLLAND